MTTGLKHLMPGPPELQAVRKHGSGYYLVIHPLNPSAGRTDFLTWLLSQQQDAIVRVVTSNNLVAQQSNLLDSPTAAAVARKQYNAVILRQMSKDNRSASFRQGSLALQLSPTPAGPLAEVSGRQVSVTEPLPPFEEQEDPLETLIQDKVGVDMVALSQSCHGKHTHEICAGGTYVSRNTSPCAI
jgi:hypothetical protein